MREPQALSLLQTPEQRTSLKTSCRREGRAFDLSVEPRPKAYRGVPSALVYVIYDMAARFPFQEIVEVSFSDIRR